MSRLPRLLPLLAVAGAGVLAINALENGPGILGAARAFAEQAAKKDLKADKAAKDAKADKAVPDNASAGAPAAQAVANKPAPICAESAAELAKDAGLSPAELQVLQSLGTRRGELDQREQGMDTQLALLQAAEAKIDAKIATMTALKGDMQGLVGQLDAKQQAEVDRLVKVFEAMKPADAAARFTLLIDDVRLPIAAKMKEKALSAMLAKMDPAEAKRLTESLAARYLAQANAARAAIAPPAAAPAVAAAAPAPATPAKAAPAPAKPTQTAQAAPGAGDAANPADASATKPKPVHRKPHTVHHPAAGGQAAASGAEVTSAKLFGPTAAASAPSKLTVPAASKPSKPAAAAPAAPAAPAPAKSG